MGHLLRSHCAVNLHFGDQLYALGLFRTRLLDPRSPPLFLQGPGQGPFRLDQNILFPLILKLTPGRLQLSDIPGYLFFLESLKP